MHPVQQSIWVFGSANTDMVIRSHRIPRPGETILGGTFFINPGGKGANQAVAAARLGGSVLLVCKLGTDSFGDEALSGYKKENIDTSLIQRDPSRASGVALIVVDDSGENSIVVASGANETLGLDDVEPALQKVKADDVVLVQLEIPLPTVSHILRKAKENGAFTILNPAPAQQLDSEILSTVDMIVPNQHEASILTGTPVHSIDDAKKAAQHLLRFGSAATIITLGEAGSVLTTTTNMIHIPAPVVKAIDTTAAGDVFCGALATAIAARQTLEESVRFATAAAAISVTRQGAQASAPYLHEIPKL